jgi:NTE family protein
VQPIRTLILSGGGGRGAFHAGVYKYLCETGKSGVDAGHQGAWSPDIVVGTSIGAVNGAAIVQGISPEELIRVWVELRERDIQGLPPGMRRTARWFSNLVLRQFIGVPLPAVPLEQSTSPSPEDSWLALPVGPRWLSERLVGRWSNLLDTGPLKHTLEQRFCIDPQRLAASAKTLLINATSVRTGERVTFSNRPLYSRATGQPRADILPGITLQRILASCSIPLVYPWTWDSDTAQVYWDGALVANTPLSGALDAAQEWPIDTPMEVVVVMMTPWIEGGRNLSSGEAVDARGLPLPQSFNEALTFTLDWMLLASFRERMRVTEAYNKLAELGRQYDQALAQVAGSPAALAETLPAQPPPMRYRQVNIVVVAPERFFPAARILDYDERTYRLIDLGYEAAQRAFTRHFDA